MVIIMMGVAGAGKTTIGHALAAELGWTFVDADVLHSEHSLQKLGSGVPLNEADRAPWIARLHAVIERAIGRREHTIVACSALKERYRHALRGDLHPVRFVYLKADAALVRHRLANRPRHLPGAALVDSQLADLEEPNDALVIDASWTPERILGTIREAFGV